MARQDTWLEGYTIKVEHLSREEMREVQMLLEKKGWHTRVAKADQQEAE